MSPFRETLNIFLELLTSYLFYFMSFFFSKCINEISALFSARNFMLFNFQ